MTELDVSELFNTLNDFDNDDVETWDPKYTDVRIKNLHPFIRRSAKEFVLRCSSQLGINLRVSQALRTIAEQDDLYTKGRTAP